MQTKEAIVGVILKQIKRVLSALFVTLLLVVTYNTSFFWPVPETEVKILSHRGVHQTFHREGLTNDTCTAERIFQPTHSYLENTLPSIRAAFDYGADMVEIDLRRTKDGSFAVFHDEMLECRTEAAGRVSDYTMDQLRALDVGYGYTADQGASFPLRGKGIGMMPSLDEVLDEFPDRPFQLNVKSNSAADADALIAYLNERGIKLNADSRLWSGPRFAARWREFGTGISVGTRPDAKACAKGYILMGWFGHVPQTCSSFGLVAPQDKGWLYWGWPRKTVARFDRAGVPVFLMGELDGPNQNIDTVEQLERIPADYRGWVLTDRIDIIGPELKKRQLYSVTDSPQVVESSERIVPGEQ